MCATYIFHRKPTTEAETAALEAQQAGMKPLKVDFSPSSDDVICARGKEIFNHEGNRRFRVLVQKHLHTYSSCVTKMQKSMLVSHIVDSVRSSSPSGGFVKRMGNRWYTVSDRHAKEKTGQTMRDQLHTRYSSSTKAKARARQHLRVSRSSSNDSRLVVKAKLERRRILHAMPPIPLDSSVEPLDTRSSFAFGKDASSSGSSYNMFLSTASANFQRAKGANSYSGAHSINRRFEAATAQVSFPCNSNNSDDASLDLNDLDPLPLEESSSDLNFDDSSGHTTVSEASFSHAVDTLFDWMHIK